MHDQAAAQMMPITRSSQCMQYRLCKYHGLLACKQNAADIIVLHDAAYLDFVRLRDRDVHDEDSLTRLEDARRRCVAYSALFLGRQRFGQHCLSLHN